MRYFYCLVPSVTQKHIRTARIFMSRRLRSCLGLLWDLHALNVSFAILQICSPSLAPGDIARSVSREYSLRRAKTNTRSKTHTRATTKVK